MRVLYPAGSTLASFLMCDRIALEPRAPAVLSLSLSPIHSRFADFAPSLEGMRHRLRLAPATAFFARQVF